MLLEQFYGECILLDVCSSVNETLMLSAPEHDH